MTQARPYPVSPDGILNAYKSDEIDQRTAVSAMQDWATRRGISFALAPLIAQLPGQTLHLIYDPADDPLLPAWRVVATAGTEARVIGRGFNPSSAIFAATTATADKGAQSGKE